MCRFLYIYKTEKCKYLSLCPTKESNASLKVNLLNNEAEIIMKTWQCLVCGLVYEEEKGWPEDGIPAGTRWEDVPTDWACPECGVTKAEFEMVEFWNKLVTAVGWRWIGEAQQSRYTLCCISFCPTYRLAALHLCAFYKVFQAASIPPQLVTKLLNESCTSKLNPSYLVVWLSNSIKFMWIRVLVRYIPTSIWLMHSQTV